jgi:GR25 family glycosyltransferase involved in LPS biosynthesis
MNNNIDHLYYINLDKRVDRNQYFVDVVLPFFEANAEDFTRISGVDTTDQPTANLRAMGCSLSHLKVYELAKKNRHKKFLVLEDDFYPIVNNLEMNSRIDHLFKHFPDFNICQISYNNRGELTSKDDVIYTGCDIQTISGYIIDVSFCDVLIPAFEMGVENIKNGQKARHNACDQIWKQFQTEQNKWYLMKRCGIQRPGYSDIAGRKVAYGA